LGGGGGGKLGKSWWGRVVFDEYLINYPYMYVGVFKAVRDEEMNTILHLGGGGRRGKTGESGLLAQGDRVGLTLKMSRGSVMDVGSGRGREKGWVGEVGGRGESWRGQGEGGRLVVGEGQVTPSSTPP